MADKLDRWVDLLRYPLVVFSLLLAAWTAQCTMGIDFSQIASIGTEGIQFREAGEASQKAVVELETRVNELETVVASLQAPSDSGAPTLRLDAASQTVSNQTAEASRLRQEAAGPAPTTGYIFIGNHGPDGWDQPLLADPLTGEPVSLRPEAISPRTIYQVRANIVRRGGLPPNNPGYYRDVPNLGVIPEGTRVRLLDAPVPIDRQFAVQYWVRVELVRDE